MPGTRRHPRPLPIALALALLLLLAAACGGADGDADGADGDSPEADAPTEEGSDDSEDSAGAGDVGEEILIGSTIDQSGPAAVVGKPFLVAHEVLSEKINDAGGIHGRTVRWINEDDQYDPGRTQTAVRKLVERDEVFMMADSIGTPHCEAVMPYLEEHGVPVVGCGTQTRPENVTWAFQAVPTNFTNARAMVSYIESELGVTRAGVLAEEGDIGGAAIDGFEYEASDALELVETARYRPSDTDLSSQASRLAGAEPEIILLAGNPRAAALFLQELERIDFVPEHGFLTTISMNDPSMIELVGPFVEHVKFTGYLTPLGVDTPEIQQFKEDMEAYAPDEPLSNYLLYAYAHGVLVLDALEMAGPELTRERLFEVLEHEFNGYENGILPPIYWSADSHVGVRGVYIEEVVDGEIVRTDSYIEVDEYQD